MIEIENIIICETGGIESKIVKKLWLKLNKLLVRTL